MAAIAKVACAFLFASCCMSLHAEDFPEARSKIDAVQRPLGTGSCATSRVGVWEADGGLVVEIRKPVGWCNFRALELVAAGQRYPLTMPDKSFHYSRDPFGGRYRWWKGDAGRVFFRTPAGIKAEDIKGIWEPGCGDGNCLQEPPAAP